MLLDRVAVDQGAVSRPEVFQKRIVEYGHNACMLTADRQILDLDIILRLATDGHPLLVQVHFPDHRTLKTEYHLRHDCFPNTYLNQFFNFAKKPAGACAEFNTCTRMTEILSRPPLSLACCTSCCAASGKLDLSDDTVK